MELNVTGMISKIFNFFRILHLQTTDTNQEESLSAASDDPKNRNTESDGDDNDEESAELNRSHYIIPEELSGNKPSDKSDIWYIFVNDKICMCKFVSRQGRISMILDK